MKKIRNLPKTLTTLAILSISSLAHANQTLNCTIGDNWNQGVAQIKILSVTDHPMLKVFKVEMKTRVQRLNGQVEPPKEAAHLTGALVAQLDPKGSVWASGLVQSTGQGLIINPQNITLSGSFQQNGALLLKLQDSNRVLQLGYGVSVVCR